MIDTICDRNLGDDGRSIYKGVMVSGVDSKAFVLEDAWQYQQSWPLLKQSQQPNVSESGRNETIDSVPVVSVAPSYQWIDAGSHQRVFIARGPAVSVVAGTVTGYLNAMG